jgi:hypothetical protein
VESTISTNDSLDLEKLRWAVNPDKRANFRKLLNIGQGRDEVDVPKTTHANFKGKSEKAEEKKSRILFLCSSPENKNQLNFLKELKTIQESYNSAKGRDYFEEPEIRTCISKKDFRKLILEKRPDIIHLSMHCSKYEGLFFEGKEGEIQPISPDQLAKYFEVISMEYRPNLLIISACNTEAHAKAVTPFCEYVVGTKDAIPDKSSIIYAESLYSCIFNYNKIETAHNAAIISLSESDINKSLQNPKMLVEEMFVLFSTKT